MRYKSSLLGLLSLCACAISSTAQTSPTLPRFSEKKFYLAVERLASLDGLLISRVTVRMATEGRELSDFGIPIRVEAGELGSLGRGLTGNEHIANVRVASASLLFVADVFFEGGQRRLKALMEVRTGRGRTGFPNYYDPKGRALREILDITAKDGIYDFGTPVVLGSFMGKPITLTIHK
jgi:hypothetical protein